MDSVKLIHIQEDIWREGEDWYKYFIFIHEDHLNDLFTIMDHLNRLGMWMN